MTVQELIIANFNGQLERTAMLRGFLAHRGWRVPTAQAGQPTIIISDVAHTASAWIMSSDEAYQAACNQFTAEAIGPVTVIEHLDDVIASLDPRIVILRVEPGGPITLHIQTDELDAFRRLARGVRIERAMAERHYATLRHHDRYYVPYYGVLGQGHNVIALPTDRGSMVAAFTTEDAISMFLATGSDENRAAVKFVAVGGAELFGVAGPKLAQGVIVNIAGPQPFGFDLSTCGDIATAT